MAGKTELVERIAFETGLPKTHAARAIEVMIDTLGEWLKAGERVVIPGLGSFYPSVRPAREARSPRSGELVHVAASRTVRFRPGKELKSLVSQRPAHAGERGPETE
jgi:DNA-binding protein HU-beta